MDIMGLLVGALIVVVGLVSAYFGSNLYKLFLPIIAGLSGLILGYEIGASADSLLLGLVLAVVFGFVGAVFAFLFWKAGVTLQFFLVGYLFSIFLVRLFGIESTFVTVAFGLLFGFVGAYFVIAIRAWEYFLALGTSVNGALLFAVGLVSAFFGLEAAFSHPSVWEALSSVPMFFEIIVLLVAGAVGISGFLYQLRTNIDLQEFLETKKEENVKKSSK